MDKFINHQGKAVLLERNNIDTDQIIPKQFLKKIEKTGYGKHLFHDWRFLDDEGKVKNPKFDLNTKQYKRASFLIAGENFGCGSSREHAAWALHDYGFRVIIAPSFADIFYNNATKNGILPIVAHDEHYNELVENYKENNGKLYLSVSLSEQKIEYGHSGFIFSIDEFPKKRLLEGLDDIAITLKNASVIDEFEAQYTEKYSHYLISTDR